MFIHSIYFIGGYKMPLKLTVNQWGNGLGIRLPKPLREAMNVKAGDDLELSENKNGEWVISPSPVKKYDLNTLLKEHAENSQDSLWDDKPVGKELL